MVYPPSAAHLNQRPLLQMRVGRRPSAKRKKTSFLHKQPRYCILWALGSEFGIEIPITEYLPNN